MRRFVSTWKRYLEIFRADLVPLQFLPSVDDLDTRRIMQDGVVKKLVVISWDYSADLLC